MTPNEITLAIHTMQQMAEERPNEVPPPAAVLVWLAEIALQLAELNITIKERL